MTVPDPSSAAPDWSKVGDEIACPLCNYNLRGLAQSRCPECGYRFDWPDLIDPARRRHPYLFEHHPERRYWSFFRTLIAGLRPRKFWALLRPEQPGSGFRLLQYHLMVGAAALLLWTAFYGKAAWQCYSWGQSPLIRGLTPAQRQTFKDQYRLIPPSYELVYQTRWMVWYEWEGEMGTTTLALLCWPVLTLATLPLFQASMRRARLRFIHLARCVVYACDAVVWGFIILTAIALLASGFRAFSGTRPGRPEWIPLIVLLIVAATVAYRLAIAFRLYLQFHRPVLTVLASQLIVALAVLVWATINDWWMYLM